ADMARRLRCDLFQVDIRRQRNVASMDPQNGGTSQPIRRLVGDPAVEATRSQERRIEDVGPVGRGENDYALARLEAIQLRQDLIERLLLLIVPTQPHSRRPAPADS